jgi:post-segregation antitoxin (ccd killing protein)
MKAKLTITVDRDLVPRAKRYAKQRGVSLSSLIETALEEMTDTAESRSFVDQWRGSMRLSERDDERTRALLEKYG